MNEDGRFWIEVCILLATIFAIIWGPIRAVKITRELDERRDKRARMYAVFSDLMKTRRAMLDGTRISALNLIELEFYGNDKVVSSFREYARNLANYPDDPRAIERHAETGDALFANMLKEMASVLGYEFDKDDLNRLSYFPRGVSEHQDAIGRNAKLMVEVLEGRRSIPITNFIQNDEIFPPTPSKKSDE
jgi:hypothetical protein